MFTILRATVRIALSRWPALLAWFLAGWLARFVLIHVAAFVGAQVPLAGILILPLAVLARLGSFIAMFLVIRSSMPSFRLAKAQGLDATETAAPAGAPGRVSDIVLASVLPFFTFYAAWQFLRDDTFYYANLAISTYTNFFDPNRPSEGIFDVAVNPVTIGIVVVAFAGRYLLKRFASALPRWTAVISVYLEAVWVYLTVLVISQVTDVVPQWVSSRAATAWWNSLVEDAVAVFAPVAFVQDAVAWVVGQAGALVLLPLAWLTLAGVVYGRALVAPPPAIRPRLPYYDTARRRLGALPRTITRRAGDVGSDLLDRWRPLYSAALLIWRAGAVPMGMYILAYTLISAGTSWLDRGLAVLVGPHDTAAFWMTFDTLLAFAVAALVEPIRIALVAAAYDFSLSELEKRRAAREADGEVLVETAAETASGQSAEGRPASEEEAESGSSR